MTETSQILKNKKRYIITLGILCPAYLFMEILFIHYIDVILFDELTFDVKFKAPEFVGHSKSGCQFQCFKKSLSYFNVSSFNYTL